MLTEDRVRLKLQPLPHSAQRVYDVVPIEATWSTTEIASELRRQGSIMTIEKVVFNLRILLEHRLIAEPSPRCFRRTPVRLKAAPSDAPTTTQREEPMAQQPKLVALTKAASPIDTLGVIAARLRDQATAMTNLAADIDAAALALQEQVETSNANDELVRTMRKLFGNSAGVAA